MRRAEGFTLVELLIAMALLAVLSGLLVGGLRISRNAVLASVDASDNLRRAELAFDVVRRELEKATPLPVVSTDNPPPIAFAGDAAGALFIAPPGAMLALGGDQITSLAIEPGSTGSRLVLRYRPLDRGSDTWPPLLDANAMQSVVLLDGIPHAEFSYFGRRRPDADPQWSSDWQQERALPTLIRLALGNGPDLVVTPQLGRPAASGLLPAGPLCTRGTGFPC